MDLCLSGMSPVQIYSLLTQAWKWGERVTLCDSDNMDRDRKQCMGYIAIGVKFSGELS